MTEVKGYIIGQAINLTAQEFQAENKTILDHKEEFISDVLSMSKLLESVHSAINEPFKEEVKEYPRQYFYIVNLEKENVIKKDDKQVPFYNYKILLGESKAVRYANSIKKLASNTDYLMPIKEMENKWNPRFPHLEIM